MRRTRFQLILLLVSIIWACTSGTMIADTNSATEPPSYLVNKVVDAAPTIDGVVDEGEWDAAAAAAGRLG